MQVAFSFLGINIFCEFQSVPLLRNTVQNKIDPIVVVFVCEALAT